jgi:hypothetical protein
MYIEYPVDMKRLQSKLNEIITNRRAADGSHMINVKGYNDLAEIMYSLVDNALAEIPETVDMPCMP